MKRFLYWFLGDRAGWIVIAIWTWLWCVPDGSDCQSNVETTHRSLQVMQRSVQKLAELVSMQGVTYEKARDRYLEKQQIIKQLQDQAGFAIRQGNESAARLVMARSIELEKVLPMLRQQVDRAEALLQTSKSCLEKEQLSLEAYRIRIQSLRDLSEINQTLTTVAQLDWPSSHEQADAELETMGQTLEEEYNTLSSEAMLTESWTDQLNNKWEAMSLNDAISERLQQLKQSVMLPKSITPSGGEIEEQSQAYKSA